MAYALENALDQWREGERRVNDEPRLDDAVGAVLDELRRRLGSAFEVSELAELYGHDTDWASEIARSRSAGSDAAFVVDAAFNRYARRATDYAGGRRQRPAEG
jgi:hypothetical protein